MVLYNFNSMRMSKAVHKSMVCSEYKILQFLVVFQ